MQAKMNLKLLPILKLRLTDWIKGLMILSFMPKKI